jgi:hypothetical protein
MSFDYQIHDLMQVASHAAFELDCLRVQRYQGLKSTHLIAKWMLEVFTKIEDKTDIFAVCFIDEVFHRMKIEVSANPNPEVNEVIDKAREIGKILQTVDGQMPVSQLERWRDFLLDISRYVSVNEQVRYYRVDEIKDYAVI